MLHTPKYAEPIPSGPEFVAEDGDGKLVVIVIFTSIEGTVAALTAAAACAKALSAEIVIQVPHVVYFRYALEAPPVGPGYFEGLCRAVIDEAKLNPDTITIDVRYCRSQLEFLKAHLKPRSVVVIGAQRGWLCRREKKLASELTALGHDVVLVYADPTSAEQHCNAVIHRMLATAQRG